MPAPLVAFQGARAVTLLDLAVTESRREGPVPSLETERLILRPPGLDDAKTLAGLVNDRRIAENTLRIPHPYELADACAFVTAANATPHETAFLICARDGAVLGACGIATLYDDAPEIGYWLGVQFWGNGFATEAARARDRLRFQRSWPRGSARRGAREQPSLPPGDGEVRLSMDRRRPLSYPRTAIVRAGRPLPP